MGGSGGGSLRGADSWRPSNVDASLDRTRQREREAEVAEVIDAVIRAINQVDTEALNRHKQTILDALNDQFDRVYDLRGGGSYTRHTHVSGLSDVDVLLDLGAYADSDIAHKDDPSAVLREMERRLRRRLPSTEITAGKMAVTVRFRDGSEIQALPAFRTGTGYRIPDPDGDGWTVTRPQVFARLLTERSREIGGGLRRSIKLAKLICANQGIDVHSYHLENMAMTAFDHYVGSKTAPAMLRHFFAQAKVLTLKPMPDVTGQNAHVDRYLETPAARQRLAKQLRSVEQQIADAGNDKEIWREMLRT